MRLSQLFPLTVAFLPIALAQSLVLIPCTSKPVPSSAQCMGDFFCCPPGYYCTSVHNGLGENGCCPSGETCTGKTVFTDISGTMSFSAMRTASATVTPSAPASSSPAPASSSPAPARSSQSSSSSPTNTSSAEKTAASTTEPASSTSSAASTAAPSSSTSAGGAAVVGHDILGNLMSPFIAACISLWGW